MTARNLLFAVALGTSAMAFTAASASAAIVCSGTACWHAAEAYDYPAESRVVVHPDSWRWADGDNYTWREHAGRGYWRGDDWEDF